MNAVIACGGTGGHLFPGLAVAEVLRQRGHDVLLFISEKDVDALALKEHPEIPFEKLPSIGLPSPFSPTIFGFVRRFNESLARCRAIYRRYQPQVVLGMGGFTSTAPVLAGKMRGHNARDHNAADRLGYARVTGQEVISALIELLLKDAKLSAEVTRSIRERR